MGIASSGALLPEGTLPVLNTPTALKPRVGLQAHTTAVPQCPALVQVSWWRDRKRRRESTYAIGFEL